LNLQRSSDRCREEQGKLSARTEPTTTGTEEPAARNSEKLEARNQSTQGEKKKKVSNSGCNQRRGKGRRRRPCLAPGRKRGPERGEQAAKQNAAAVQ
jgi:hypothetical protein